MSDRSTDPVTMEALDWFVRMRDDKVGAQERRAFATWLAADPAHPAAFERAQSLWDRFDIVEPEYRRLRRAGRLGRRDVLLGGLATLVAAPVAYVALNRDRLFATYRTGTAERRSFMLGDGSRVELGSSSALAVDFSADRRRVVLVEGEGFFQVAPDAARPFVVEAENGSTRALGTAFDVKLLDDSVAVTVVEHAVSVTVGDALPVTLEAGWQVSYGPAGLARPVEVDTAVVQAWRQDRIVFEDVPLDTVLRELERYRHGRIVLMDRSVGAMPVTAVFETTNVDAALATIAATLPVRVIDGGLIAVVYGR
ncbi:FecR family protein [Ancylobacter oerskovii]|uniref:FecR family protein n=1 Tax=Ancylobacter oerskovii TaxID=459519 RepID=A0ABW4YWG8_9HYPH|nr:FecR family protein [Ancylobacter oerskovii]MBS7544133.1 FecR family protein [Ancylobacter oerskovii]